jgi:hypothetical protein
MDETEAPQHCPVVKASEGQQRHCVQGVPKVGAVATQKPSCPWGIELALLSSEKGQGTLRWL